MQPVSSGVYTPSFKPVVSTSPSSTSSGVNPIAVSGSTGGSKTMNWKERGDYHLARKEWPLAIESYTKALSEAEEAKKLDEIASICKCLGTVFLGKEEWHLAAKFFNGAEELFQQAQNEKGVEEAFVWMTQVENGFLEKQQIKAKSADKNFYKNNREKLKQIRGILQGQFSHQLLVKFSGQINLFLEEIVKKGMELLGPAPTRFAFLGLGSLSRQEMSPYSDLEFAILLENASPASLAYFKTLVKWLEIQVICLGETEIKLLEKGLKSPVKRGFSYDDGGNTPLGKEGYIELIKTPDQLADCQTVSFYQEDLILSNVLRSTCRILGEPQLHQQYCSAMDKILKASFEGEKILFLNKEPGIFSMVILKNLSLS